MWADGVVLLEPGRDDGSGLIDGVEPLCIEDLSVQRPIKTLIVAVLSGCAWRDADRLDTDMFQPDLEALRQELRAVVGSDKVWVPVFEQQR